ncbi:unnamed protein product [Discosporangium mesarthrocarpum]
MKTCSLAAVVAVVVGANYAGAFTASVRSTGWRGAREFESCSRGWIGSCSTGTAGSTGRPGAGSLSMISATFGQKINTDKIIADKTAIESLSEEFPDALSSNPDFAAKVGHGDTKSYSEEELRNKLKVGRIFTKMANIVLLSRGLDVISPQFEYYSPSTGMLDRASYMALIKTLDVAFSSFSASPVDFKVYKDGVISYTTTTRTQHDGFLQVGDKMHPPTGVKVVSDEDLCTVSFDENGLIRSFSSGLLVRKVEFVVDQEMVAEIEELEKKIEGQKEKMIALEGQESAIAYQKCKQDVESMMLDQTSLKDKINAQPNTMNLGGLKGVFAAIGVEFPSDVSLLFGSAQYESVEGDHSSGFSYPSEVSSYGIVDSGMLEEMEDRVLD